MQFSQFAKTHSSLLLNAYTLQDLLKSHFNYSLWNVCVQRRMEISRGEVYISINEIMKRIGINLIEEMAKGDVIEKKKGKPTEKGKKSQNSPSVCKYDTNKYAYIYTYIRTYKMYTYSNVNIYIYIYHRP